MAARIDLGLTIIRSAVLAAPGAKTHPHSSSAPSAPAASLFAAALALSAAASAPLRSRRALEGDRHFFWNGVEVESQADVIPKGNDKFRSMYRPGVVRANSLSRMGSSPSLAR